MADPGPTGEDRAPRAGRLAGGRECPTPAAAETLTVPARFNGPPGIANGGWIAGCLATILTDGRTGDGNDGHVEVALRRGTPLDVQLDLERTTGGLRLSHDGRTLVDARLISPGQSSILPLVGPPPPFVEPELAARGATEYTGLNPDGFRGCVVCGPDREPGDGLRVFAWRVPEMPADTVAAVWRTHPSHTADGAVPEHHIWAALDCPTFWAHIAAGTPSVAKALLVRQTVIVKAPVRGDATYVVVARAEAARGRALWGSGGLYTADGDLVARTRTMWMTV